MASRTLSKILALTIGATLSVVWLSTIVVGLQSESKPAQRTIELPTVVIVAHKSAALNATAQLPARMGHVG